MRKIAHRVMLCLVQAMVFIFLPLVAVCRGIIILLGIPQTSYWTGTPILTLTQKAASERMLGGRVLVIVRSSYRINENFDIVLSNWCRRVPWLLHPLSGLALIVLLATASRVHSFADGGLLLSMRQGRIAAVELLAYRLLKIPYLVWTYGADVRTRERTLALGKYNCCTDCPKIGGFCICDNSEAESNIQRLQANGAIIFSMGDMMEYTPGSRNDLFFWPLDLDGYHALSVSSVSIQTNDASTLRVVHAPNHREFKGTRYLESAIRELQTEGVPIELVLVEGLPNAEAIKVYRTADIIFDQCLIGFYGYFALEAMALGKPVMCYIREPSKYLLHPEECPIINTNVESLKKDLRDLVASREQLRDIGLRGRAYVEQYFSRQAFAERLSRAYHELGIS